MTDKIVINWSVFNKKSAPFPHPAEYYGVGIAPELLTEKNWRTYIKGLYDWITKRQRTKKSLRKKRKFIILTFISKSHKGTLKNDCRETVYHAHLLVWGQDCTAVVKEIQYYWCQVKKYSKRPRIKKCWDNNKLIYNLDQAENNPMTCISPIIAQNDLNMLGIDKSVIAAFKKTHRLPLWAVVQAFNDWGLKISHDSFHTNKKKYS